MPALIKVYNARGTMIGCCDAKCYNATVSRCRCVCQGTNHGIGLQKAAQNSRQFSPDSLARSALSLWPTAVRVVKHSNLSKLSHPTLFDAF